MNTKNIFTAKAAKGTSIESTSRLGAGSSVTAVNDALPSQRVDGVGAGRLMLSAPGPLPEMSEWYEKKRSNMRRLFLRLAAFTLIPTLLAAVYFGLIVTDRYVSQFQVTVNSQSGGMINMFSSILGDTGGGSSQENYVMEEYIKSHAVLEKLDEQLDLRGHYSQDYIDPLTRLKKDATNEEFLDYYLSKTEVTNDATTMIMTVRVQAFSPDMAKTISDLLIALCEDLVNNLNEQSRMDTLAFAQSELDRAENRFRDVRLKISSFRNREGDLNPLESAAAITAIISSLEAQVSETRVEIASNSSFMRSDSVRISGLNDKLNALTQQVKNERKRLVNTQGETVDQRKYNDLLSEYESLLIEEQLTQVNYEAANQAYQIARAEAAKQQYVYLVAFAPPVLPDESTEPRRLYSVLVAFIGALVMYLLGSFTWASLREHVGA